MSPPLAGRISGTTCPSSRPEIVGRALQDDRMTELDPEWLRTATVGDLLAGYARILAELRHTRGIVRSNNAPVGDYAEYLSAAALGAELVANFSVKSYDLVSPEWGRVQVKARLVSDPPTAGQLQTSPFRSWDFEHACLVQCRAEDYTVSRAALVPVDVVKEHSRYSKHVGGSIVLMTPALMGHEKAHDITELLAAVAGTR
jgi:hypothetical protein